MKDRWARTLICRVGAMETRTLSYGSSLAHYQSICASCPARISFTFSFICLPRQLPGLCWTGVEVIWQGQKVRSLLVQLRMSCVYAIEGMAVHICILIPTTILKIEFDRQRRGILRWLSDNTQIKFSHGGPALLPRVRRLVLAPWTGIRWKLIAPPRHCTIIYCRVREVIIVKALTSLIIQMCLGPYCFAPEH